MSTKITDDQTPLQVEQNEGDKKGETKICPRILGETYIVKEGLQKYREQLMGQYRDKEWLQQEKQRLVDQYEYKQLLIRVGNIVKELEQFDLTQLGSRRSEVFELVTKGVSMIEKSDFFPEITSQLLQSLESIDKECDACERSIEAIQAQYRLLTQLPQSLESLEEPAVEGGNETILSSVSRRESLFAGILSSSEGGEHASKTKSILSEVISEQLAQLNIKYREAREKEKECNERREQFESSNDNIFQLARLYLELLEFNKLSMNRV